MMHLNDTKQIVVAAENLKWKKMRKVLSRPGNICIEEITVNMTRGSPSISSCIN